MKKLVPMAAVALCIATAAFASVQHPRTAGSYVQTAMATDTIIPENQDTTVLPQEDTTAPAQTDTSSTVDTSGTGS